MSSQLRRLDALRNDKGPESGPRHQEGSDSDPSRSAQGSSARPLPWTSSPDREVLVDEAVRVFGQLYGHAVAREEAHQAMDRLVALFELLAAWDREKQALSHANGKRAA